MNTSSHFATDALEALRNSSGAVGRLKKKAHALSIQIGKKSLDYVYDVKLRADRTHILNELKTRSLTGGGANLVIFDQLTETMASHCRALDLQFIDLAGNAYITDHDGALIYVAGRKRQYHHALHRTDASITPSALRMIFAFLSKPSMLNAPYRDIARAVKVSTGSIGKVFATLETRGLIGKTASGNYILISPEQLLSEWATGYASRLRPKLKKYRFNAPNPATIPELYAPEMRASAVSAWGGEVAADILTGHLSPATYTIYLDMEADPKALSELVRQCQLRADPNGPIEVIQSFWDMDEFFENFPSVPKHLVYADLLNSQDPRNLGVAKTLYNEIIQNAISLA